MMHKLYIVINLNKDEKAEKADEKRANFRLAKTKKRTLTHTWTHTHRQTVRETKKTK